jgi:hypothetical protein
VHTAVVLAAADSPEVFEPGLTLGA